MTQEELKLFFKEYQDKTTAYSTLVGIMDFDNSTVAPKGGSDFRNKMGTIILGEYFSYATNPENIARLEQLDAMDNDEMTAKEVQKTLKSLNDIRYLPKDVYVDYQAALANGHTNWEKAKQENDYVIFEDSLKEVITQLKKTLTYDKRTLHPYDKLLDRFEEGMNVEQYDKFFALVKEKLVPFIKKLQTQGKKIDDLALHQHFHVEQQAQFIEELKRYFHLDPNIMYVGVSTHPFTMKLHNTDTRFTVAYPKDSVTSSTLSFIHEYGHALFGSQVDKKYSESILSSDMGMGLHESQSRLLENYIGRNAAFWKVMYPKLTHLFPEQLGDVSLAHFLEMMNASYPGFIRIEADELTYPIHVLIRYEIEKMIFNEHISLDHLDQLWADKYEEYLGIRPTRANDGILQDIHWSQGMFGYFPTYALGSAFAAQFFHQMSKDINVEQALLESDFIKIQQWLQKNIHQYGASIPSRSILLKATNEDFNPQYYIDYLIKKYSDLYF